MNFLVTKGWWIYLRQKRSERFWRGRSRAFRRLIEEIPQEDLETQEPDCEGEQDAARFLFGSFRPLIGPWNNDITSGERRD